MAQPAELIEFVVKAIVEHKDDVTVHEQDGGPARAGDARRTIAGA